MKSNSFRSWVVGLAVAGLMAIVPGAASAAPIVEENFAYDPGTITGLSGGTGFTGAFTGGGNVTSPGLSFPGLVSDGNKFTSASNNTGAFRAIPTLDTDNSPPLYIAFLASTNGTTPNYGGISFFDGTTEELFLGKPSNTLNYGYDVSGAAGGVGNTGPAASTTPALLVYRLTFSAAGDSIDFWANPTPGAPLPLVPTATFAIPEDTFAGNKFDNIRLQSGDQPINFDQLRAGLSFADVAPAAVPEPTGIAAVIGLAGGLVLRRRRAARAG